MEHDKNNTPDENMDRDRYVDEITRDKIHKHISDPNSRITEEDIAAVNTDMFKRPEEELSDEALKGEEKTPEPEEEETPKAPNSWDILEE